jgi:hypothetical protein
MQLPLPLHQKYQQLLVQQLQKNVRLVAMVMVSLGQYHLQLQWLGQ